MGDLLRAIREAEAEPEHPYFVCLDEMNLARVEHYFADILSVMETGRRSPDGRWITDTVVLSSGSDLLTPSDEGADRFPPLQSLPDNLVLFGTVNVDESTYPFSRKVLDRANTIEFNTVDFRLQPEAQVGAPLKLDDLQRLGESLCHRPYRKLPDVRAGHPAVNWNEPLIEINAILESEGLHFGYRVRDEILIYMAYAIDLIESLPRADASFDEATAFDFQIMQKILPRLSGPGEMLRDVVGQLVVYCEGRYLRSEKKLKSMLRRLDRTGFTQFWAG
jgi:5-methylcytosine-specific restriction endonuclease McrBC GTP-binding regulatory subunit McrB